MLSSLLNQFRQRYPQGSLTSDLLTIHDGQYVVRVCAGVEGITLTCGLGANPTLEVAEDLATTRALERLGHGFAEVSPPRLVPVETQPQVTVPGSEPAPVLAEALPNPRQLTPHSSPPSTPPGLDLPGQEASGAILEAPPIALAVPPASPGRSPTPEVAFLSADADADLMPDSDLEFDAGAVAPIDLSDIIAQTDVELQRLGWGVNQGREFLEKTYGKRSRHDLTDDELLEFLLYLETQSPPGSP